MIKGIGVDIVEIERFRKILDRWGGRFIRRLFTEREREDCLKRADPVPHFAVRFAAKEAFSKAIGTGFGNPVFPKSIEVVQGISGSPRLVLWNGVCRRMEAMKVSQTFLSLSHDGKMGIAFVVLEGEEA